MLDVHNSERQYLTLVEKVKEGRHYKGRKGTAKLLLSKANKDIITKYSDYLLARLNQKEIGHSQAYKYLYFLSRIAVAYKNDLAKVTTREKINKIINLINNGKDFSAHTRSDIIQTIKVFYKWLRSMDNDDYLYIKNLYPKEVAHLRIGVSKKDYPVLNESNIPTDDEFKQIVDCEQHTRNKAMLTLMFEGALGISDIVKLKVGDVVSKDGEMFVQHYSGKVGANDRIMLDITIPYLANWLNQHPDKNNPQAQLFVNIDGRGVKPMTYSGTLRMLQRAYSRSGINWKLRKFDGYTLRHYRITYLRRKGVSDVMLPKMAHRTSTKHFWKYEHLVQEDTDDAYRQLYGKVKVKKEGKLMNHKYCQSCATPNEQGAVSCVSCGNAFVDAQNIEDRMEAKMGVQLELMKQFMVDKLTEVNKAMPDDKDFKEIEKMEKFYNENH